MPWTIWSNADLPPDLAAKLAADLTPHTLIMSVGARARAASPAKSDARLGEADIAFGQPDPAVVVASPRLRWVHLSTAGFTNYDRDEVRAALRARGAVLTKSSVVYDEPCAEHVLAFLLAQARVLVPALDSQRGKHDWPQFPLRARCRLLRGQSAVLMGFGTIGRRLIELLRPFEMRLCAIRRTPRGDEGVPTFSFDDPAADGALGEADHVIDLLPASPSTARFFDAARLALIKPGAIFYNIGRGTTVDQDALAARLASGALAAAWLDVADPEPLPPDHPLWTTPNCQITPHAAGGHDDEWPRLVAHFLDNFARYRDGRPLVDQVV